MAEIITFLVALPLLYLVGEFYYRLGVWLCLALSRRADGACDRAARP